jgi:hypothetical protein
MTALLFRPFPEVRGEPHVMADGPASPGCRLVLSHWPQSTTPWPLKADLSSEIAFAYLDDPTFHVDDDVRWVTNDHLDVDGFVSVYVLSHPEEAQERRDLLIEVAAAGDFAARCSDRAANIAFAIGSMRDLTVSTLPRSTFIGSADEVAAHHYAALLPQFTALVDDIDSHAGLWRDERSALEHAERALDAGEIRIEEVPDSELAIVWLPPAWPGGGVQRGVLQRDTPVHPLAVHRRTDRWQVAYVDAARRDYRLVYRFESWVQLLSKPAGRADLRPVAKELQAIDPAGGDWIAGGRKTFLAWLKRRDGGPSGLTADQFVSTVVDGLVGAPITWTPYDPKDVDGPPTRRGPGY